MQTSLFYLPSIGSRSEMEAGMAGTRRDLYGKMLREISEQAQLADSLGYEGIYFTEHHFHVEGFEISQNPILLDLFVAMQTERIRVGQLGLVLPTVAATAEACAASSNFPSLKRFTASAFSRKTISLYACPPN